MKNNLFFLIFLIILFNCAKKETRETNAYEADSAAIKAINEQDFATHIKTLASDDFQGRRPFTEGEEQTINYLKEQFQQLIKTWEWRQFLPAGSNGRNRVNACRPYANKREKGF